MNRRAFLTALGAVATQQKFGIPTFDDDPIDPPPPPPPISTARRPYVQNVRNDRASLLWATNESGVGSVRYSADGVIFRTAPATSRFFSTAETGLARSLWQHQADITGLAPNTDYVYGVSVDGQDIPTAGKASFRTAGPGPFSFIVLGDSGWGGPDQASIAQRLAAEKPTMVVHTGDLVYMVGTYETYQRNYFNFYESMMGSVPFFPCPGNHDYDVANAFPYLAIHAVPNEGVPTADRGRYYSYDWGNVHFVSIDAHQSLERAVNSNGPMLRWLENDLRSTRQFWRIAYFHYPPFASGQNTNDIQSLWVRQYVVPILEKYGVQVVFSGHEHSYQRNYAIRKSTIVDPSVGTNYITSGGGGAFLYSVAEIGLVAFAKSAYHYVRAEVQGTRILFRSIRQDGVELESFSIAPTPAFSDDPKVTPVTMSPGPVAGAFIRIIGRGLATEESFMCTPAPPNDLAGTMVTVNGQPIQLLYVSPTQIFAQLPFAVDGNITIRITTSNGFVEKSI
jgi:Calcineurin-like phosphoesterase/Purple acid Phosphatase, N-terminal domain/IPT/TIG domain